MTRHVFHLEPGTMRHLAVSGLMTVFSVCLTLLAAEVTLRLAAHRILGSGEVLAAGRVFRFDDEILGFRLDPGSTRVHARGGSYVVRDRINSLGMRDVEHSLEKPAGVYRILILGDSFMYGTGVPMKKVMARRLAALLPKVEVINAGVHAYGLSHEYLYYKHRGRAFSPDLVLLAFFMNDVEEPENTEIVDGPDGLPLKLLIKPSVRARLDAGSASGLLSSASTWLRHRSLLYTLVRKRIDDMRWRSGRAEGQEDASAEPDSNRVRYAPAFHEDPEESWGADWARAGRILDDLRLQVAKDGARLAIVLPPAPFQLSDRAFGDWARWAREPLERLSRTHPQDRIKSWCEASSTPCLDLMPVFEGRVRDRLFLVHDYHWTGEGHRVAALAVRDFLLRDVMPAREH